MASKGHNEKTQQELYEDQQFLRAFTDLKVHKSELAATKGDMGVIYKRAKDIGGWTKQDFEFAQSLEDKDVGQVIAEFERKIRIAKLFGHRVGRQLDLLAEDQTPEVDRAYEAGHAAGSLRKDVSNPYLVGTPEHQRWEEGNQAGHQFINRELAEALSAGN